MSEPVLPLLVAILLALFGVGVLAALWPGNARQAIGFAGAGLCGFGCLLCLVSLLSSALPADAELPLGPPGMVLVISQDPLSSFFLLFVFLAGAANFGFAAEVVTAEPEARLAGLAFCLAGLDGCLIAADAITLTASLSVVGGALWAMERPGRARAVRLGTMLAAAALLLAAVILLTPVGMPPRFDVMPSSPVVASRAGVALCMTLVGGGALAGLVPLHGWTRFADTAPPAQAAMLTGGLLPIAVYLLLRIGLGLAGTASSVWWSLPFLLMGATSTLLGGWRSALDGEIEAILAAGFQRVAGLASVGIGLVLVGRSADLPSLSGLALASVLLLSAAQILTAPLALLSAEVVRHGAGTGRLVLLGGLIRSMPAATLTLTIGLFALSGLPFSVGFAGSWLLFQALLAAPRAGGLAPHILLAGMAAVLALSGALATTASVRLLGVVGLGRPRSPRAAAAADVPGRGRWALLTLATVVGLFGLFPGAVLRLLAEPSIRMLTGDGLGSQAGFLGLSAGSTTPGYSVLPLAALVALCGGSVIWLLRRRGGNPRTGAAWHGGFARAPTWLPFGDPLAQSDGEGFVPELPRMPRLPSSFRWLPELSAIPSPVGLWAMLVLLAGILAMLSLIAA